MSRCDLNTYGECSCRAEPTAIEIFEEANRNCAGRDALTLVFLAALVWILTFYAATVFDTTGI
jgi:hypothetical protein